MQSAFNPRLLAFLERCASAFEEWPVLHDSSRDLRELVRGAPDPFRVAVVGRMKGGKSTLINSLIGRPLAIVGREETTATINVISHGTPEQSEQFIAVWKDGRAEPFPLDRLLPDWSGKGSEVVEKVARLHHLQLFATEPKLREFEIIDTPGGGSVVEAHEDVIRDFLSPDSLSDAATQTRKADAILYVLSSEARDSDLKALSLFGQGRLVTTDPYNCLSVMQKWDRPAISFTDDEMPDAWLSACGRATRMHEQIKNRTMAVLPVSGALGLAARNAPDEFFALLLEVLRTQEAAKLNALASQNQWDADAERARVCQVYVLPPSCLLYLVQVLVRQIPASASEARARCLELSQLPELERLLELHFFANAMTIKQCQMLRTAGESVEPGIRFLLQFAAEAVDEAALAQRAAKVLTEPVLAEWALKKSADAQAASRRIQELAFSLSNEWDGYRSQLKGLQSDLCALRHLHAARCKIPAGLHAAVRFVCGASAEPDPGMEKLRQLVAHCSEAKRFALDADDKALFAHMEERSANAQSNLYPRN